MTWVKGGGITYNPAIRERAQLQVRGSGGGELAICLRAPSKRTAPSFQVFQIDEPFFLAARDRIVDKIPEAFVL